ncbi:MAG: hypothetical protein ACRELZ_10215, partial [Candidatus Rokuibacteriota bacterium]
MQLTASLVQKSSVGHLERERMLEAVFEVWKEARFVEQLGGLEVGEASPKVGFTLVGHCLKQRERYAMADDRRCLEQTFSLDGQPVDARGQNRVNAGRNLDGVDGLGEAVHPGLPGECLRLHEGSYT